VDLGGGWSSAAGTGSQHSFSGAGRLRPPLRGRGNGDRSGRASRSEYIYPIPFALAFAVPLTFSTPYRDIHAHKHTNGHADTDTHTETYPYADRHTRKLTQPLPNPNVWGHGDSKVDKYTPAHFTSGIRCTDHVRAVGQLATR
jgi:hypothetical protein